MSFSPLAESSRLLQEDDPPPVELINGASTSPTLVICDHASRAVPRRLGRLGLDDTAFERHIAWDIGAAEVARRLAARLDAPLVMSGYSRLVIDVNRRPDDLTSMPEESDGTVVPVNQALTDEGRRCRIAEILEPYHRAIAAQLEAIHGRGQVPMMLSIHSFTPVFKGFVRPWQAGVLWNQDGRLAMRVKAGLEARGFVVGDNKPYSGQDRHGYTLPRHAEAVGFPHVLIELRQNMIDTLHGAEEWAGLLHSVLESAVNDPALRKLKSC
jgi:predicted N-formylglutamate amidohydrolase